jgi:hypothetical protein
MICRARDVQLERASRERLEETCAISMNNEPDLKATNSEYAGQRGLGRNEVPIPSDVVKIGTAFIMPRADGMPKESNACRCSS